MTFGDLPAINACLNGASALFLGAGVLSKNSSGSQCVAIPGFTIHDSCLFAKKISPQDRAEGRLAA